MTFTIPYSALESGKFSELLEKIEKSKERLGITDYGVADTSLEEIFLVVAEQREPEKFAPKKKKLTYYLCCRFCGCCKCKCDDDFFFKTLDTKEHDKLELDEKDEYNEPNLQYEKLTGRKLRNQQVTGLYIKRWHNVKRNPKAICSQIFLPPFFIFLGSLIALLVTPQTLEQPSKLLTVYPINDPKGPYMFTSDTTKQPNMTAFQKVLLKYPHHSFRCIKGNCFLSSLEHFLSGKNKCSTKLLFKFFFV